MGAPEQFYGDFEYFALIDLLAEETKKYTAALVRGQSGQMLENYHYSIKLLSKEIELRKRPTSTAGDADDMLQPK